MFTKQETFDIVARGLLAQNARSTNGYTCMFRDAAGRKCAVGFLISDEEYTRFYEGDIDSALRCVEQAGHDRALCRALMTVHDCCDPADWKMELAHLAGKHGLEIYAVKGLSKPVPVAPSSWSVPDESFMMIAKANQLGKSSSYSFHMPIHTDFWSVANVSVKEAMDAAAKKAEEQVLASMKQDWLPSLCDLTFKGNHVVVQKSDQVKLVENKMAHMLSLMSW